MLIYFKQGFEDNYISKASQILNLVKILDLVKQSFKGLKRPQNTPKSKNKLSPKTPDTSPKQKELAQNPPKTFAQNPPSKSGHEPYSTSIRPKPKPELTQDSPKTCRRFSPETRPKTFAQNSGRPVDKLPGNNPTWPPSNLRKMSRSPNSPRHPLPPLPPAKTKSAEHPPKKLPARPKPSGKTLYSVYYLQSKRGFVLQSKKSGLGLRVNPKGRRPQPDLDAASEGYPHA